MRLLLGVSGSVAAYKAIELARLAGKAGHSVRVVMTEAATRFVGPVSFASVTGAPVLVTEWEPDPLRGAFPGDPPASHAPLSHLALAEHADVFLVAPASATTLAKLATGVADNLLTAAALACRGPLLLAPAMNHAMYEHPATQANLATLRARGAIVLEPGTGALGSPGEWGVGRLPEPADLLAAAERAAHAGSADPAAFTDAVAAGREERAGDRDDARDGNRNRTRDLEGKRVLVTAGGTREPIDAVRFVGNRSSGRMGWALAEAAARRGARVTVVAANVALPRSEDGAIAYVDVGSAQELAAACAEHFPRADVLLMAAAVADYRPAAPHAGKLKKDAAGETLTLELTRTTDVLTELAEQRTPQQLIVGFAAEHGPQALANAREKRARKRLDAIVLNDVSTPGIAFESAENEVHVITAAGETHLARAQKSSIADAILDVVLKSRSETVTMLAS